MRVIREKREEEVCRRKVLQDTSIFTQKSNRKFPEVYSLVDKCEKRKKLQESNEDVNWKANKEQKQKEKHNR